MQTFPKANTKEHYSKILPYLSEYKKVEFLSEMNSGYKEFVGLSIKIKPRAATKSHADYIRTLLAGMGYTVEYDNDTITIK